MIGRPAVKQVAQLSLPIRASEVYCVSEVIWQSGQAPPDIRFLKFIFIFMGFSPCFHEEALKYGVKVTGATVHFVNEIPDGGEIIMQKAVEIKEGDTPEILQKRVMQEAEWIILPQATEYVSSAFFVGAAAGTL